MKNFIVDWILTIALLFGWDIQKQKPRKWERIEEIDRAMGVPRWGKGGDSTSTRP